MKHFFLKHRIDFIPNLIEKQPKKEVKDSKSRKIEGDPGTGIASGTQVFPEHVVGKCVTQMEIVMNFFWPMREFQELLMSIDFKLELVKTWLKLINDFLYKRKI